MSLVRATDVDTYFTVQYASFDGASWYCQAAEAKYLSEAEARFQAGKMQGYKTRIVKFVVTTESEVLP